MPLPAPRMPSSAKRPMSSTRHRWLSTYGPTTRIGMKTISTHRRCRSAPSHRHRWRRAVVVVEIHHTARRSRAPPAHMLLWSKRLGSAWEPTSGPSIVWWSSYRRPRTHMGRSGRRKAVLGRIGVSWPGSRRLIVAGTSLEASRRVIRSWCHRIIPLSIRVRRVRAASISRISVVVSSMSSLPRSISTSWFVWGVSPGTSSWWRSSIIVPRIISTAIRRT